MKRLMKVFGLFLITTILYAQPSYNYMNIFFLDENHGWILGTEGHLWKTTNAGNNWEHVFNTELNYGIGIQFTSPNTGWITKDSELLNSTDGGFTWQEVFANQYSLFWSNSYFINDSIGFISSNIVLFQTTDAGENWEMIADTLGSSIRTYFYDEILGFMIYYEYVGAGNFTYVYKTTDLGTTWTLSNECGSSEGCGFGKIQMLNENQGYMSYLFIGVVPTDVLLKTTDGGNSWKSAPSPFIYFGLTDFEFLSVQEGWITTNNKIIYRTTNAGAIWDTLQQPTTLDEIIKNFEFFNSNISYGISSNHIYYTNDGWVTYSILDSVVTNVNNQTSSPIHFTLYQNYPNPFNPSTTIKYSIPIIETRHASSVQLLIFDVLGKEVATLVNEEKPAGSYEVEFNANNVPSGVYFYKLQAGNYLETKKNAADKINLPFSMYYVMTAVLYNVASLVVAELKKQFI